MYEHDEAGSVDSLSRMFNEKPRQTVCAPKWPDAVAVEHSNSTSKKSVTFSFLVLIV
jgi:hypothetical protein